MAVISFKNVGIKHFETEKDILDRSLKPIGIKTPIEYGAYGDGLFRMHYDLKDQIHDNLKNLVLTNHGERLGLYDFGANLLPLLFEFSSKQNFDSEAMIRINTCVSKYMPFISLIGYESEPDYEDNKFIGKIKLLIIYGIPELNLQEKCLEIILNII